MEKTEKTLRKRLADLTADLETLSDTMRSEKRSASEWNQGRADAYSATAKWIREALEAG